jgi:hypothetical protein
MTNGDMRRKHRQAPTLYARISVFPRSSGVSGSCRVISVFPRLGFTSGAPGSTYPDER